MIIRGGRNLGATCYFPKGALAEPNEALASFLMQYYAETPPPRGDSGQPGARGGRGAHRGARRARRQSLTRCGVRRARLPARWMAMTVENASQALRMRRARRADIGVMLAGARAIARPRARAGATRVLRHQPHGGRGHGRVLRGVRPRRSDEEGISAFQHHRRHARRRLRRAAPGAQAPLRAGACRRSRGAGCAAHRRRPGPDQRGACRTRAARIRCAQAGRRRQGTRSQGRAGTAVRARRARRPSCPVRTHKRCA